MAFKLNISQRGRSWKMELDSEALVGKKLGDKISGQDLSADLAGYELQITGASDIAGFPHKPDVEGPALRRVLLTKGWGMHKKPRREGKKKVQTPHGLRLKKTIRGKELSEKTVQVNFNVVKEGAKTLNEIFPEQNKAPEPEVKATEAKAEAEETQTQEKPEQAQEIKTEEEKTE